MNVVDLPIRLEAHEPPEARGVARDRVRLLVSSRREGTIVHGSFRDLPRLLVPGDVLVINTSATLPAAVPAMRTDGAELELRFSTPAPGRDSDRWWVVEVRRGDEPFGAVEVGRTSYFRPRQLRGSSPRMRPRGSGSRTSISRRRLRPISPSTVKRFATATYRSAGHSPRTRTSTQLSPVAPRCRARADPSQPS